MVLSTQWRPRQTAHNQSRLHRSAPPTNSAVSTTAGARETRSTASNKSRRSLSISLECRHRPHGLLKPTIITGWCLDKYVAVAHGSVRVAAFVLRCQPPASSLSIPYQSSGIELIGISPSATGLSVSVHQHQTGLSSGFRTCESSAPLRGLLTLLTMISQHLPRSCSFKISLAILQERSWR